MIEMCEQLMYNLNRDRHCIESGRGDEGHGAARVSVHQTSLSFGRLPMREACFVLEQK